MRLDVRRLDGPDGSAPLSGRSSPATEGELLRGDPAPNDTLVVSPAAILSRSC